ncbi:hypothetical protein ACH3VR_22190 [Microbacterium sp. B2969]|uniref:MarR family transcriptional regulator n=1 Tax=Microbacterium alkaliflavum TaxID=3248839 RepID=A0ABW7QIG5_9MICO
MRKLSPTQLKALARIHLSGLVMRESEIDERFAASLDLEAPNFVIVNIATVRVLLREGLITRVRYEDDPPDVDYRWGTSARGRELLHENRDYLADAGREISHYRALTSMWNLELARKSPHLFARAPEAAAAGEPGS